MAQHGAYPRDHSARRAADPTRTSYEHFATLRRDWLSNPRGEVLAGMVVALALIPKAIGFSIIAGVDPRVGLYALVGIAIVVSFMGVDRA